MKKAICLAAAAALVFMATGCANGPVRNWLKGAPCSTCNPAAGILPSLSNTAGNCESGVCGSGIIGQPAAGVDGFAPGVGFAPGQPVLDTTVGTAPAFAPQGLPAEGIPIFNGSGARPSVGPTSQYNYQLPTGLYGNNPNGIVLPPPTGSGTR